MNAPGDVHRELERFMAGLKRRNPHEPEFHQAVEDLAVSVMAYYVSHERLRDARVLERLTEPDRILIFRVVWETDDGRTRLNRAWRVQFNHALGPYKGGLRFHPTVDQGVLKFLGFEQIFKNALTGLPMGGAKGGSNFDPKGRSEREVMRFCQSLMTELHRHIGQDVDVPAGDIGVGRREVNYLFGQYMRLENRWSGAMTGKGREFGGSALRIEATGYGCVYFCERMLEHHGYGFEGRRIAVSGSGNVALYAAEKAIEKGARVVTLSDSDGTIVIDGGLTADHLAFIQELKEVRRGRIREASEALEGVEYRADEKPWTVDCDIAMPCATQNELDEQDAEELISGGVIAVCEGANMPTTTAAAARFREAGVLHAPGKAANAGGVAVSGLEQSQNAMRLNWSRSEVDDRLQTIMCEIHERCVANCGDGDIVNYVDGANLAAFKKVADAMLAYGIV